MDYQKHYEQLIAKHGSQDKPEGYSERHHILPKSMGGSDDASNLVYLSAKAHFVAHHLLWRWHRNAPMAYAFKCMCDMGKHQPTATAYQEMRAAYSLSASGKGNHNYGKTISDEARAKQSVAMSGKNHPQYGKPLSAGHRAKLSKANSGSNHWAAKTANIYCHKSGVLLASGVLLTTWARANNYSQAHLSATTVADRTKPSTASNRLHTKGIYARYI